MELMIKAIGENIPDTGEATVFYKVLHINRQPLARHTHCRCSPHGDTMDNHIVTSPAKGAMSGEDPFQDIQPVFPPHLNVIASTLSMTV